MNNAEFVNTQFYLIVLLVISHDHENLRDHRIYNRGDSETDIEDSETVRFELCWGDDGLRILGKSSNWDIRIRWKILLVPPTNPKIIYILRHICTSKRASFQISHHLPIAVSETAQSSQEKVAFLIIRDKKEQSILQKKMTRNGEKCKIN